MNKTWSRIGIGVLIAVGLFSGRLIGRYVVNKLDDPHTRINDGEPFAAQYIANCDTIQLVMRSVKDSSNYFKAKGASNISSDNTIVYIDKHQMLFYDSVQRKYFNVLYYFNNNSDLDETYDMYSTRLADGMHITGVVNQTELHDPAYGLKEKPVPVLYFSLAQTRKSSFYEVVQEGNRPYKGDENSFRKWILSRNVSYYLSYTKQRADFEKMFGVTVPK